MKQIPVLITAYNRVQHLNSLLKDILNQEVDLTRFKFYFFIDASPDNLQIIEVIDSFKLDKNVVIRKTHLGLKNNVIQSLTEVFDLTKAQEIILLEDDLKLSKFAFQYAQECISLSPNNIDNTFGISLYSQLKNEWNSYNLELSQHSSFFTLPIPSSLGSIIFNNKWTPFVEYYNQNRNKPINNNYLPKELKWNQSTSWKIHLLNYLNLTDQTYLYPTKSYSAHLGSLGTNVNVNNNAHFNSHLVNDNEHLNGLSIKSVINYDLYFEVAPTYFSDIFSADIIKNLTVDLFGTKPKDLSEYYLTSKKTFKPIKSYGFHFRCLSDNILFNVEGNDFYLVKAKDLTNNSNLKFKLIEASLNPKNARLLLRYLLRRLLQIRI